MAQPPSRVSIASTWARSEQLQHNFADISWSGLVSFRLWSTYNSCSSADPSLSNFRGARISRPRQHFCSAKTKSCAVYLNNHNLGSLLVSVDGRILRVPRVLTHTLFEFYSLSVPIATPRFSKLL